MKVLTLTSRAALRDNAERWNDLWKRSTVAIPVARAEHIDLWLQHFAPTSRFVAFVVESDNSFIAGLPLVFSKKGRVVTTLELPGNDWSHCGQLLLDPTADAENTFKVLFSSFGESSHSLMWLDEVGLQMSPWVEFREFLGQESTPYQQHPRFETAVIPVNGPLEQLKRDWKKHAIQDIQRRGRKLAEQGVIEVRTLTRQDEILEMLPRCFDIEDRSWKGQCRRGGSILKRGVGAFYEQQASLLATEGSAYLYCMLCNERLIAFSYCYGAKGVLFCMKIGYDPAFRAFAPGQNLQLSILTSLCECKMFTAFDCLGVIGQYQEVWNPRRISKGQIVLPLPNFTGRFVFRMYDTIMPGLRRMRHLRRAS